MFSARAAGGSLMNRTAAEFRRESVSRMNRGSFRAAVCGDRSRTESELRASAGARLRPAQFCELQYSCASAAPAAEAISDRGQPSRRSIKNRRLYIICGSKNRAVRRHTNNCAAKRRYLRRLAQSATPAAAEDKFLSHSPASEQRIAGRAKEQITAYSTWRTWPAASFRRTARSQPPVCGRSPCFRCAL